MKRTVLLATVAALTLSPAAFAQQSDPGSNRDPGPASRHVQLAPADQTFVKKAQIGNLFEIKSSEAAEQNAQSEEVKDFAEQMIRDHGAASEELIDLADKLGTAAPNALDAKHAAMLQNIEAKRGAEFDRAYIQAQRDAHREAIDLFSSYVQSGGNDQLKSWARETLPTLQEHSQHIQELNVASRGGASSGRSAAEPKPLGTQ